VPARQDHLLEGLFLVFIAGVFAGKYKEIDDDHVKRAAVVAGYPAVGIEHQCDQILAAEMMFVHQRCQFGKGSFVAEPETADAGLTFEGEKLVIAAHILPFIVHGNDPGDIDQYSGEVKIAGYARPFVALLYIIFVEEFEAVDGIVQALVGIPHDPCPFLSKITGIEVRQRIIASRETVAAIDIEGSGYLTRLDMADPERFFFDLVGIGLQNIFQGWNPGVLAEKGIEKNFESAFFPCPVIYISRGPAMRNTIHMRQQT